MTTTEEQAAHDAVNEAMARAYWAWTRWRFRTDEPTLQTRALVEARTAKSGCGTESLR